MHTGTASFLLLTLATAALAVPALANMADNPGFEDGGAGWGLPEPLYAIDDTVAHSGSRSLRYHNEPGGPYLIAGQGLKLEPGRCYRMSVWVKTEGIASTDTGATISMEWSNAQGYAGGAYPAGLLGTSGWRQVVYETGPIPDGITGGSVIVYGRSGTSGTAWFDDVEVVQLEAPLARWHFADTPPDERRKTVVTGVESPEVRLIAELSVERAASPEGLALYARIHGQGKVTEITKSRWHGSTGEVVIPTAPLALGETQIEVGLADAADGRPITGEFLTIEKQRLMRASVVAPNPAGMLGLNDGEGPLSVRIGVTPRVPGRERRYWARLSFSADGRPVGKTSWRTVTDRQPGTVAVDTEGLGPGLYDLCCELYESRQAEPVDRVQLLVTRGDLTNRPANATYIGPNRMLMVCGEPFFPMGFYILSSFETVFPTDQPYRWQTGKLYPSYYVPILDRLAASRFNCFIDYGSTMGGVDAARELMDAAHARGLRAIFSVKDLMPGAYHEAYTQNLPWKDLREATRNVVGALREHPALVAWYVNDEVILPEMWQGAMDVFRDTRATDPWHPTYAVHYDYMRLGKYREACDIIGTDPYTLTGDIGFAARDWHESRQQLPPEQPFWAVVQCFGAGYEFSRPSDTREPTHDEERAATFAAIAEGATGIIYYCYHSLERSPRFAERFEELDRIAGEVQDLVPIIALPDAEEQVVVESGVLSALTKAGRDRLYIILASTQREDQDVVLRLPDGIDEVRDRQTGEVLHAEDGSVVMRYRALDARVLEAHR